MTRPQENGGRLTHVSCTNRGRMLGMGLAVAGTMTGWACVGLPAAKSGPDFGVETGDEVTTTTTTTTTTTSDDDTTTDITPTHDVTSSDGTTTGDDDTGSLSMCGNDQAEPGEACDGLDLRESTCETLGYMGTGLGCVNCSFDVSACGSPPGMAPVPSGAFTMGSDSQPDEQPIRQVITDGFWIDVNEVTAQDYAACVTAGFCAVPLVGTGYNYGVLGREYHPINGVSWFGAEAYCGWVDGGVKRLPTEAEWEKVARGTDARAYPWGDLPHASCMHVVMSDETGDGCGAGSTAAVGSRAKGASPHGAMDMAGNVWEWVSDWYGPYLEASTENPTGPAVGDARVMRGAGWNDDFPHDFRAANRRFASVLTRDVAIGFRCARSLLN